MSLYETRGQEGPIYRENISETISLHTNLNTIYHTQRSKFQLIHVVDLDTFGRALILDGHMQSASNDEFAYHEMLVHPVMLTHKTGPKTVFIAGGGEGATTREVLRHKSVEKVIMCDIDVECVDVCRKFLPTHHQGSFEDPRAHVVIEDAKKYLEESKEKFDVIIFDLDDPVEGGPCKLLYTEKFYQLAATRLNPGGLFITQSGPAGLLSYGQVFSAIHKTLNCVFKCVFPLTAHIPAFVDLWSYNIAALDPNHEDFANIDPSEIDKRLKERLVDPTVLKYYDGLTHRNAFALNKVLRTALKNETRIISEDTPLVIP